MSENLNMNMVFATLVQLILGVLAAIKWGLLGFILTTLALLLFAIIFLIISSSKYSVEDNEDHY